MNCLKRIGLAGLAVVLAPVFSKAAVIFEFKDVAPGDASPNSIDVHPGDTFSFAVWFHANATEHVNGVSFLLRNASYSGDKTFTLNGLPDTTGSDYTSTGVWTGHPQPLVPDNYDALATDPITGDPAPRGSNLGGELASLSDWRTGDQYIGKVTLVTDPSMPLGSYLLTPNSSLFSWTEAGDGSHSLSPGTDAIGYTVNVVPEPSAYALVGATGLLGFAAYRRFSRRQVSKS